MSFSPLDHGSLIDLINSFRLVLSSMRFLRCTGRRVQINNKSLHFFLFSIERSDVFFFCFGKTDRIFDKIYPTASRVYTRLQSRIHPNGASRLNNILPTVPTSGTVQLYENTFGKLLPKKCTDIQHRFFLYARAPMLI